MSQRLTVKEAAAEIGCDKEYLRRQMKAGRWDLGSVIKPTKGLSNYQYFIFRAKLDKFLGKEPRAENEEVENEKDKLHINDNWRDSNSPRSNV